MAAVPETTHRESSLSREEAQVKEKVKAAVLMNLPVLLHCSVEEGHSVTLTTCQTRRCILILASPEGWLLLICDKYEEKTEKSSLLVETLTTVSECLSSV